MKIYNGKLRLPYDYTLVTDEYEYTMVYGYMKTGKNKQDCVFDIFFRKVPNDGGYVVMAGLDLIIDYIKKFNYSKKENIDYFKINEYPQDLIDNLKKITKFTGDIYAVPDGTPIFPTEPVVTIRGALEEVQLLETAFLAILNGATSHATGARRVVEAVPSGTEVFLNQKPGKGIMEFGARRADGLQAAIDSSIYGIMGGCIGTSNVAAAYMLNMRAMGTMAHSWVEAFPSEFESFKAFAEIYPNKCILLVDTYDTLRSGIPNAIKTFKYMQEKGINTNHIGIRIDSGDLAYLSKEARKMLDEAGFPQATICLSNNLDAPKIESLNQQGAQYNSLGIGDNIAKPEGNIGFVDKLSAVKENGIWIPKIKLSNDHIKIINPGYKKLYRAYDKSTGYAIADIIAMKDEKLPKDTLFIQSPIDPLKSRTIDNYELRELQKPIFLNGELVYEDEDKDLLEIQKYCNEQMGTLYPEVKRTVKPHEYHVAGTENYVKMKLDTIEKAKKLIKKAS